MAEAATSVGGTLDTIEGVAEEHGEVSVGDVLEGLGSRSYGPFLTVPALIALSPVGGIPGVPTLLALIIILLAAQMVWGRTHFWLPGILSDRRIPSERLRKGLAWMRPVARRMDRWFHGRLEALTGRQAVRVAAAACIVLALAVPPLEVVPFVSSAPMAAIALFGLALLAHDGLLMLVAGVAAAAAAGTAVWFLI
ncbi:MAG: exopolysaccharide biosynthesis protein [Acetobacterales bacterium]